MTLTRRELALAVPGAAVLAGLKSTGTEDDDPWGSGRTSP